MMKHLLVLFSLLIGMNLVLCSKGVATENTDTDKPESAAVENIKIGSVEFTGVKILSTSELESVLEIGPGDLLDRQKVVRSAENIRGLYEGKGYYQPAIRTELVSRRKSNGGIERILLMNVSEGNPTKLAKFHLKIDDGNISGDERKDLEEDLGDLINIGQGELLESEKISGIKRKFLDYLAGENYANSQVKSVRFIQVKSPVEGEAGENAVWVDIEVTLSLNERISFGFQGNTVISVADLNRVVNEQRALGFGTDYLASIKIRIEEEYTRLGYSNVKITPYNFENFEKKSRHISFFISEGIRRKWGEIDFEGNLSFSSEHLRSKFLEKSSRVVQGGYFVLKDLKLAAEQTIDYLRSEGYLFARFISMTHRTRVNKKQQEEEPVQLVQGPYAVPVSRKKEQTPSDSGIEDIQIFIYEGDQTKIGELNIQGVSALNAAELQTLLGVQVAGPMNLVAFTKGLELIKARYRSLGYLAVQIENEGTDELVRYSEDNRTAYIELKIKEGPLCRVSKIEIEGLRRTSDKIARREIRLEIGDVIEERLLLRSESALRRLGLFSSVGIRIEPDPQSESLRILKFDLKEGSAGLVEGGPGFRNDLGFRFFGQGSYGNLWKSNHTVYLTAQTNRRIEELKSRDSRFWEYQAALGYQWPWFILSRLLFRPQLTAELTKYRNFNASTVAMGLNFSRPVYEDWGLDLLFSYNLERVRQFSAEDEFENQRLRIGGITPGIRLDLRDNRLAPTKGLYSIATFEYADPRFLSQQNPFPVGYTRFQFRGDYFQPFFEDKVIWYFSFRTGIARNLEKPTDNPASGTIPLIKQFTLGGVGSLRGYREQELRLKDTLIRGTLTFVNYRTHIDLPFSGPLRFVPFLDAANINKDTYSLAGLRYGSGFGFHVNTPVGSINFDWGFKLNGPQGSRSSEFYFSIGTL